MEQKSPKKRLLDEQEQEGTPEGKKRRSTDPGTPLVPLKDTPQVFRKVVKHNVRSVPQLKFDMEVTKYLVSTGLPFSHVNHQGFHSFIKYLDPKYIIKNNRTFMRSKLPLLYKIVKEAVEIKLSQDLEDCKGVCFTTDLWSSRNQDPYLGLTIHYINKSWKLNRLMIHCGPAEGRHTAVAIAQHLDKVIGELKSIPEGCVRTCTSDNASNMLAAIPALTNEIETGLGCADHLLNLIVNKAFSKDEEIAQV